VHQYHELQVDNVMAEKFALSMANNPHVVKLYYSFQSPEALYLVMEYLIGGDLSSLLQGTTCSMRLFQQAGRA
jgi:serine/threonine protein kinase